MRDAQSVAGLRAFGMLPDVGQAGALAFTFTSKAVSPVVLGRKGSGLRYGIKGDFN